MFPRLTKPQAGVLAACAVLLLGGVGYILTRDDDPCYEREESPGTWAEVDGETGMISCRPCPAGRFYTCPETDADCTSLEEACDSCEPGTYADEGKTKQEDCIACAPGETDHDEDPSTPCLPCEAGKSSNARVPTGDCLPCSEGAFSLVGSAECTQCVSGKASTTNNTACEECVPGKYQPAAGRSSCFTCGPGNESTANNCTACGPGRYDDDGDSGTACDDCPEGRYVSAVGQIGICPGLCENGTYAPLRSSDSEDCSDCEPGHTDHDVDPSTPCAQCPTARFEPNSKVAGACGGECGPGYTSPTGSVDSRSCSSVCVSGQFNNPNYNESQSNNESQCINCNAGLADLDDDPRTKCEECPEGRFTMDEGNVAAARCEVCGIGFYSGNASSSCEQCQLGKIDSDQEPSTPCINCSPGKYTNQHGQVICTLCPAGSITDTLTEEGGTNCSQCLGNTGEFPRRGFSPNSTTPCGQCAPGWYGYSATGACLQCDPGSETDTLDQLGATSCIACAVGRFSNSSLFACQDCAAGSTTDTLKDVGATMCARCSDTTFSPSSDIACAGCDIGWRGDVDTRACLPCADGSKIDIANHTFLTCPACPVEERCSCKETTDCCTEDSNSEGNGCASCKCGYFTAGSRCLKCPSSVGGPLIALFAITMVIAVVFLWRVSKVSNRDDTSGTNENNRLAIDDMQGKLSNLAVFGSMATNHLHITMITFEMPFGWPRFLVRLGKWIGDLFSFDFGRLMIAPECNLPCGISAEQSALFSFLASHCVFLMLMAILATAGHFSLFAERRKLRRDANNIVLNHDPDEPRLDLHTRVRGGSMRAGKEAMQAGEDQASEVEEEKISVPKRLCVLAVAFALGLIVGWFAGTFVSEATREQETAFSVWGFVTALFVYKGHLYTHKKEEALQKQLESIDSAESPQAKELDDLTRIGAGAGAGGVRPYRVLRRAAVSAGLDLASSEKGHLEVGEIIQVAEIVVYAGRPRVRFQPSAEGRPGGWASVRSGGGRELLQPLNQDSIPSVTAGRGLASSEKKQLKKLATWQKKAEKVAKKKAKKQKDTDNWRNYMPPIPGDLQSDTHASQTVQVLAAAPVQAMPGHQLMAVTCPARAGVGNADGGNLRLSKGDRVTWTKSDDDIPIGSVGTVQGPAHDGRLSVEFHGTRFNIRPDDLQLSVPPVQIQGPSGTPFQVAVPAGVGPGQTFHVQVPTNLPPQAHVQSAVAPVAVVSTKERLLALAVALSLGLILGWFAGAFVRAATSNDDLAFFVWGFVTALLVYKGYLHKHKTKEEALQKQLEIMKEALVRTDVSIESTQVGILHPGDVVNALEYSRDSGHERVRIGENQWISMVTARGNRLARNHHEITESSHVDAVQPHSTCALASNQIHQSFILTWFMWLLFVGSVPQQLRQHRYDQLVIAWIFCFAWANGICAPFVLAHHLYRRCYEPAKVNQTVKKHPHAAVKKHPHAAVKTHSHAAVKKHRQVKVKQHPQAAAQKHPQDLNVPLPEKDLVGRTLWVLNTCVVRQKPDLDTVQVGKIPAGTAVKVMKAVTMADGTVRVGIDSVHDSKEECNAWITYYVPAARNMLSVLNAQYLSATFGASTSSDRLTHTLVKSGQLYDNASRDNPVGEVVAGQHVCVFESARSNITNMGRIGDGRWIDLDIAVRYSRTAGTTCKQARKHGEVLLATSSSSVKGRKRHLATLYVEWCLTMASAFMAYTLGHEDFPVKVLFSLSFLISFPIAMINLWRTCHAHHFDASEFAPGARVHKFGLVAGRDGYVKEWDPYNPKRIVVDFSEFGGHHAVSTHISLLTPVDETSTEMLRHSANARAALFLFSACMLMKSCISTFDFSLQPELSAQLGNRCIGESYLGDGLGDGIIVGLIECPSMDSARSALCTVDGVRNRTCSFDRNVYTLDSNPKIALPFAWDACDVGMTEDECDAHLMSDPEILEAYTSRLVYLCLTWALSALGILVYGVYLPLHLFWHLYKSGANGRKTPEVYQENGWILLKYKPSSWWFEFVLLFYKLWIVVVSTLLSSGAMHRKITLLQCLAGATVCLLSLVVARKPFRDSEASSEGLSGADKSEVLALVCYLGELAVGIACMTTRKSRPNNKLSQVENAAATVLGMFFVILPVAQMVFQYLGYQHRVKQRRLATMDSDGLKFPNPLTELGGDDDGEVVDAN